MSGNPFRRNAPGNVKLQAEETRVQRTPSPFKIGKKEKRVKIQTPPQSPEEVPRRLSAGRVSPPPPEKTDSSDDDSDTTATADSDIEQAMRNTRRNSGSLPPPGAVQAPSAAESPATTPGTAPYNPFARTLATSEAAFGLQKSKEGHDAGPQTKPDGARKGMDVDMFKNILMTGSPAPTPPQTQHPQDSSSNTDTSSVSKNSLFDQNYNLHPESPRSSFDHVDCSDEDEADDENGGLMGANKERLDDYGPPAPPKSGLAAKRSKGPQTVSFSEFDDFSPMGERSSSPANAATAGKHRPIMLQRTSSDLNKPLPKTPPWSPGLPQEVPHSMDAQISQAPQPATPAVTAPDDPTKKAPPPPPPTTRRAGQVGTSHNRARSTSDTAQSTAPEPASPPPVPQDAAPKTSGPPPPPPSRKSKPSHAPSPAAVTSTSEATSSQPENQWMQPPPAPAPRRNPSSKTRPSMHRSPSNASHNSVHSHASPAVPPAPPPRRAMGSKRESLDGAAQRRSSQNSLASARSGSQSKPPDTEETKPLDSDILADMTAFQAEIDALRKQAEKGG